MGPADPGWLRGSGAAILAGVVLVSFCYFFVDRPVAYFVHDHGINRSEVLKTETLPPPILQAWAPAVLAALAVRRLWGPFQRWQLAVFAAAIALVLADQFRESLSFLFGRYWPDTWIDDNPSLIRDGAYGFHPFHSGSWYGSFPSGHAARMLALVTVSWVAYPRSRWLGAGVALLSGSALVGMNYHFVGDVVAGGFVGAGVGAYTAWFAGLNENAMEESRSAGGAL